MSITAIIGAKVLKATFHGDSSADIVVETSMDGQTLGVIELRVNRVGKEAEAIACEMAKRMAADLPAPAPKPKAKAKPAAEE